MTIHNKEAFLQGLWDWAILDGCFGNTRTRGRYGSDLAYELRCDLLGGVFEMRFGPYRAGRRAETFLRERLAWGPVAVSQLEAAAREEMIVRSTLYRTARRIGVVRTSTEAGKLWALPAEPEPPESAEPLDGAVAETDARVEQLVAEVRRRMSRGQRPGPIVHRIRKALGAETAAAVKAEIGRG